MSVVAPFGRASLTARLRRVLRLRFPPPPPLPRCCAGGVVSPSALLTTWPAAVIGVGCRALRARITHGAASPRLATAIPAASTTNPCQHNDMGFSFPPPPRFLHGMRQVCLRRGGESRPPTPPGSGACTPGSSTGPCVRPAPGLPWPWPRASPGASRRCASAGLVGRLSDLYGGYTHTTGATLAPPCYGCRFVTGFSRAGLHTISRTLSASSAFTAGGAVSP